MEPVTHTGPQGGSSATSPTGSAFASRSKNGCLRIMHVVNYLRRGGTEFGILKLMEGLDQNDFEHHFCTTREYDPEFVEAYHLVERLSVAGSKRHGLQFPLFRLKKIFEKYRPDIVHTRNWGALEAVPAARLAHVPVVIHSEHGYEPHNMTGLPLRQRFFRRLTYRMVDEVFAVTEELRKYHAEQAWIAPERMKVIYNGVDTRRFSPNPDARERVRRELRLDEHAVVLGSVGRLVPIKDYGTLLKAAEIITKKKNVELRVLLVGQGPELEGLQKQAESECLKGKVIFQGASDCVPELLNAMDIFVITSLSEGMSNTLMEAMATGLPVVATRAGGNPEVIGGEQSDLLFAPGDVGGLAERVGRLAVSVESRLRAGEQGRARMRREFSLQGMYERYADLYTRAMAKRPGLAQAQIEKTRWGAA